MAVGPRRPKGPHLNALRAFEAAARLKSFSAAADELSVTPGAVTQHIKTLEAWIETELFIRDARGVRLTSMAEEILPGFTLAFDQIGSAVQSLRDRATPQKIRVAALPSIAQLWLAPRLGLLRQHVPELSVSVVAMETAPNLVREPFDITIFYSSAPIGPMEICIMKDKIFPVCAPSIAARISSPADLNKETLLHDGAWAEDWDVWLKTYAESDHVARSGTTHSLYSIALEEARHGGGVLIGHEALVQGLLDSGDLVRPLDGEVELSRNLVAEVTPAFRSSTNFEKVQTVFLH